MLPREHWSFRLYKVTVVSEAILDHSRFILTLKQSLFYSNLHYRLMTSYIKETAWAVTFVIFPVVGTVTI